MSSTWTFAQLVDTLKTQLDAHADILALTPVPEIRVSVPHAQEDISDVVVLGIDVTDTDKMQAVMGAHSHDEDVTVGCMAAVIRYGSGDTEAQAARDRVLALLDIVDDQCRTTPLEVGLQTLRAARVGNRTFESFPAEAGETQAPVRVARIAFDITYKARTTP